MGGFYPLLESRGDNIIGQIDDVVPSSTSKIVDSFLMSECASVYWLITGSKVNGERSKQHVSAFASDGMPEHILPAKFGNSVKFKVDVFTDLFNLQLLIENKEAEDIIVKVTRIKTLE